jgi:hypothetical protein
MTDRLLHAVYIPGNARTETGSEIRRRLAKTNQSGVGSGIVEAIGLQPGEQLLTGYFAGRLADVQRRELEELFDADGIAIVPYATRAATPDREDGYYALEDVSLQNPDPREERFARFDGRMVRKGTRESHRRAIKTAPQPVDTIAPTDSTPRVGLASAATKVRWFDAATKATEPPTPIRSVTGEHGDIDIYDADEPSFDSPELLYTLPYRKEYETDCRVWDTYGKPKELVIRTGGGAPKVGEAQVGAAQVGGSADTTTVAAQWQRVYSTDHEFRGAMLVETDVLRATISKPDEGLEVARWDDANSEYRDVPLTGSWQLYDSSLTYIGQSRIECRMEFADTDSTARQELIATFVRGLDSIQFVAPAGGTVPTDLVDYLAPVTAASDRVAQPTTGLRKREAISND